MAQQWYTITEDGVFGQRQWFTGDQIPMEWAVEWGLAGAALAEGEFFDAATKAALAAELADPESASRAQVEAAIAANSGQLPYVEPNAKNAMTTAQTWPTANAVWMFRFRVGRPLTISHIAYYVGTASGNIDVGVYTSADGGSTLTRVGSSGSTVAVGANAVQNVALSAPVDLEPGTDYWLAMAADNTTLTVLRVTMLQAITGLENNGLAKTASFPLPTTISAPIAANNLIYLFGH